MQRKRELKGSYKAKLSLEKLIIEFEKKRLQVKKLRTRQSRLRKQLTELRELAGETPMTTGAGGTTGQGGELVDQARDLERSSTAFVTGQGKVVQHKAHHEYLIKEMLWM